MRTKKTDPLAVPSAARPRAERSITWQPGAPPSSAAIPVLTDALNGKALVSHPERDNRPIDSTGRRLR